MTRINNTHWFHRLLCCSLGVTIALSASSGLAATDADADAEAGAGSAAPSDVGLTEIVVTAERREESLQKTSVALQVLSAAELQNAGIVQMRDLSTLVPGLQIGNGGAASQIYIRGVGDFGSTPITNPAVATNLDGVYIARPQGVEGNLFDIARVEVLKGPQGTLYGRNASGGAINIITARPSLEGLSGYGDVEFGNFNEVLAEGAVNLPVNAEIAIRASGQAESRQGYLSTGDEDDRHQSVRLQGLFKNDVTSVLLAGQFTHLGGYGTTYSIVRPPSNISSSPWTAVNDPRVAPYYNAIGAAQGNCIPGGFFPGYNNPGNCPAAAPYPSPPFPPGKIGPYDSLYKLPVGGNSQDNKFTSAHAEITQNLGGATLTILPAFQKSQMAYSTDPAGLYYVDQPNDSTAESVEARLGGNSAALKWVGGLYYFHETQFSDELVASGLTQNNLATTHQRTRSEAAFGELNFSVTDAFRLIAGARFTDDNKTESGSVTALYPSTSFLPNAANPTSLKCFAGIPNPCELESFSGDKSFTKFTWKAGAEYDLSAKNMLYATVSTGFKAGGFNQSATSTPGSTTALSYDPEVLTAYELGSRNRFLNDRLQVNFEGFYWKYHNHQEAHLITDGQGVFSLDYVNAGDATSYGLDIDVVAKLTRADSVHGAVEWLHSVYNTFGYDEPVNPSGAPFQRGAGNGYSSFNPFSPLAASTACAVTPIATGPNAGGEHINCSGFPLSHAPRWSGNLGYEHKFLFDGGGSLTAAADANFATSRYLAVDFLPSEDAASYVVENVYLTYAAPESRWSVQLFVRNLSDAVVYTGGYEGVLAGFVVGTIGAPRTFGGRATVHF
jgi:iron complex outermembrane receptor protein